MTHTDVMRSPKTDGLVVGIIVACIWNFLLLIFTKGMPPPAFPLPIMHADKTVFWGGAHEP